MFNLIHGQAWPDVDAAGDRRTNLGCLHDQIGGSLDNRA